MLIPYGGWIGGGNNDPEGTIVCPDCGTPAEHAEWLRRLADTPDVA